MRSYSFVAAVMVVIRSRVTDIYCEMAGRTVVQNGGKKKWKEMAGRKFLCEMAGNSNTPMLPLSSPNTSFQLKRRETETIFYLNELDLIHRRIEHITYHNTESPQWQQFSVNPSAKSSRDHARHAAPSFASPSRHAASPPTSSWTCAAHPFAST